MRGKVSFSFASFVQEKDEEDPFEFPVKAQENFDSIRGDSGRMIVKRRRACFELKFIKAFLFGLLHQPFSW